MSDDNYIPVDDAMQRFEDHLLSHDRVVLSAKFGDGKTFFLNKNSRRNVRWMKNRHSCL